METIISSHYRQTGLPKLHTTKLICRRDSLSSSRTRDSGYNSDLDSLSPVDILQREHDVLFKFLPPIPPVPVIDLHNNKPGLVKAHNEYNIQSFQAQQAVITSNPTAACTANEQSHSANLPNASEVDCYRANSLPMVGDNLPVHDEEIEKWIDENLPSRNRPKERVSSITSLSSTSSCDLYTDTDVSDNEELNDRATHAPHLPSTVKIVEIIVRKVEINLRHVAQRQCPGESTSGNRASTNLTPQQKGRESSQHAGHKRNSRMEGSPPSGDDDDEGPRKRRRGSAVITDDSETGAKFACPYYKHDPDRYRNRRTCGGPGWPTAHRMKEHLYRSHAQPIHCPICYATFKSDKEQSNHVRLQQCQRSAPQQIEGIDRETVWTLRKRTTALRLEEDKWRDVYHVLFPDVPIVDIPSPFYDYDSPSESSRRFRRELLRRVQDELFATAERVPSPIEQQLLQRVAQIIRNCEQELLSAHATTENAASDRRVSTTSSASMMSMMSSSEQVTPAHTPTFLPVEGSTIPQQTLPRIYVETSRSLQIAAPGTVHCGLTQYLPEPTVDFTPIIWDDPTYEALDWDGIFPPGSEDQDAGSNEVLGDFTPPMYT